MFLVLLQEKASFWWKTLPFPEEVPKKPKNQKDFRVLAKARLEESKIFVFFVFLVLLQEKASLCGKRCRFLRRYQKNQKTKDFRVLAKARLEESKIFVFFGFFGTPPGKCKLLVENVAIS